MATKIYRTKIANVNGIRPYVLGRISGIMDAICQLDLDNCGFPIATIEEVDATCQVIRDVSAILTVVTDAERYETFKTKVSAWYPYIEFDFDYNGNK